MKGLIRANLPDALAWPAHDPNTALHGFPVALQVALRTALWVDRERADDPILQMRKPRPREPRTELSKVTRWEMHSARM